MLLRLAIDEQRELCHDELMTLFARHHRTDDRAIAPIQKLRQLSHKSTSDGLRPGIQNTRTKRLCERGRDPTNSRVRMPVVRSMSPSRVAIDDQIARQELSYDLACHQAFESHA
jgi:hypothetical protein